MDFLLVWGVGIGGRLAVYAGLLFYVGTLVVHALQRLSGVVPDPRYWARIRLLMSSIVLVGVCLQLVSQMVAAFGAADGLSLESLRIVAIESRWGQQWRPQAVTSVALVILSAPRLLPPLFAASAAVAFAVARSSSGHAAAASVPGVAYVLQSLHLIGAGIWIGGLAAMTLPVVGGGRPIESRAVVRRFSRFALAGFGMVLVGGVGMAFLYLDPISELVTTAYGLLILSKLLLLTVIAAFGAYNWRRLTPLLDRSGTELRLLKSARLELVAGAAVLVVSSVLVNLGH